MKLIDTELTVAEDAESRRKAQSELNIPDPEDLEAAKAAIEEAAKEAETKTKKN